MILSGLEIVLITAGTSLFTGTITGIVTSFVKDKTAKINFADFRSFQTQVDICHDRFERSDRKMKNTNNEVAKIGKRFERFIVYSELSPEIKGKILDGD